MKASASMKELVRVTDANLRLLGHTFTRNEGREMVEFDVSRPVPFLIRITHLQEVEHPSAVFGLFLPSRQGESTDLRIELGDGGDMARQPSSELVRGIIASLKSPPWKGLGFIESSTSRALWSRAAEGRE